MMDTAADAGVPVAKDPATTPDVRPGQVWLDNNPRSIGRYLMIDGVYVREGVRIAECTPVVNRLDAWIPKGRRTRIQVSRFRPTSTGYRLVVDVRR